MTTKHAFTLLADYFQFYLQDEAASGDLSAAWTPDAVDRLLAVAPGVIGVGTVRNKDVPFEVEVLSEAPSDDPGVWDRINECSVTLDSGKAVIAGCTDYFPDAARLTVVPGVYRARIYYGKLGSVSPDRLEGADHYRIALWLAPEGPLIELKSPGVPDT
jgi:hypothetical protein